MRVAYVTPRYGVEVQGGAETACRRFAEQLVSLCHFSVDIFTTCADDAVTWANAYPSGTSTINGVDVHRFASKAGRDPEFHEFASRLLSSPETATMSESERFIELQGPVCPDAVSAAIESSAQLLIFYPYLFYPTVKGLPLAGRRAVMHPAAHDEPAIRLAVFPEVFQSAGNLVFQTFSERAFCERAFRVAHHRQVVLGLGTDLTEAGTVGVDEARRDVGVGDAPYLLCVGRLEDGKGTTMLARFFSAYKERCPGPLKLVLAGQVVQAPDPHPDIITPGVVADDVKSALLRGATAFVQPSYFEAFSISLIEAMSLGVPVIVNGTCGPLREHAERSGGGVSFDRYANFEAIVERLVEDAPLRAALGANGAEYAERHFTWPVIIERYRHFLASAARGAA